MIFLFPLLAFASPAVPSDNQMPALHRLIRPQLGEDAWEQIPWSSSLSAARAAAVAAGKPILLWEMDGHPLGCT
jgi:hypothetical protein